MRCCVRAPLPNTLRTSESFAKLSEICTSCIPLPSAASRLSSGIVYPLIFFQFEMHGGIFQSCWSFAVIFRGGLCMTGAGGDGGPRGMRLCLNLGGSIGSTGASTIRMTRDVAPEA